MLIRSQNKRKCTILNDVWINEGCKSVWVNGMFFGEYSTEEKTMKVLDMICEFANGLHFENVAPEQCGRLYGVVFQMPQDSEV